MITGIGTDICSIPRMQKAIANSYFLHRVFCEPEIEYARSKSGHARHYAAAFAAKEAFAKATGLGLFGVGLKSVWVVRTEYGPKFAYDEELTERLESMGVSNSWLSITHEADLALAFVVMESKR